MLIVRFRSTTNRTKPGISFDMAANLADHSSKKRKRHQSSIESELTIASSATDSCESPKPRYKTKYARRPAYPGEGKFKQRPNGIMFKDTPEKKPEITMNTTTTVNSGLDSFDARRIKEMQKMGMGMEQRNIMGLNAGIPRMTDQRMYEYRQSRIAERPTFAAGSFNHFSHQAGQRAYPTPENTSMPTYNTVGGPNRASNFGVGSSSRGSSGGQYGHRTGVGDSRRGWNTGLVPTTGLPTPFSSGFSMGQGSTAADIGGTSPNAGHQFNQHRGNTAVMPTVVNPSRTTDYSSHGSHIASVSRHSMAGSGTLVTQIPTPANVPLTTSRPYNPRSSTPQGQDHSFKNFKEPETIGPRVVLHNPKYDYSRFDSKWFIKDISTGDILTVKVVTGDAAHVSRVRHGQDDVGWVPTICFEPLATGEDCACPPCTACLHGQPRKGCNCKCFCLHEGHPDIEVLQANLDRLIRNREENAERLRHGQALSLPSAHFGQTNLGAAVFGGYGTVGAAVALT